ncbi:MAG: hypothetical protein PHW72_01745 [Candidatus Pacebacteria bacterium]|nr:hypothetical protein [Candidatus Paceibacterota bacterium]
MVKTKVIVEKDLLGPLNESIAMDFETLRKKYPQFIYESFSYKFSKNELRISFKFKTKDIFFNPRIVIREIDKGTLEKDCLNNLVFNLGLAEMVSYWKATCSPQIIIKAGRLDDFQIKWWHNFMISGMGQFYYENNIDWRSPDFIKIISSEKKSFKKYQGKLKDRYLVPFAGGRDSIVTLENLKKTKKEISLFTVNPIEKIQRAVKVSGIKKQVIVLRKVDRKLLELNKRGFLNGHTPFTALLSFLAVLCAAVLDYKHIFFSNEKSADEGNVRYLGRIINHQWAKSSEFEKKFKLYAKNYLAQDIDYFSFLRKYGELKISKMLTRYPQYFPVFSSCNAGMKISAKGKLKAKERWCGNCPKCLFVYLSIFPILDKNDLKIIFGKDIFENKKLLPILKELVKEEAVKPLECVGTKKESRKALSLCLKKIEGSKKVPYLLAKIKNLNED